MCIAALVAKAAAPSVANSITSSRKALEPVPIRLTIGIPVSDSGEASCPVQTPFRDGRVV